MFLKPVVNFAVFSTIIRTYFFWPLSKDVMKTQKVFGFNLRN